MSISRSSLARTRLADFARQRSIEIIRERFQANVRFGQFTILRLYPRVVIRGANVGLEKGDSSNYPPLIVVQNFSLSAELAQFLRKPTHIHSLELSGMRISVPPRRKQKHESNRTQLVPQRYPVIVDNFECHDCELNILPKIPSSARCSSIHRLSMQNRPRPLRTLSRAPNPMLCRRARSRLPAVSALGSPQNRAYTAIREVCVHPCRLVPIRWNRRNTEFGGPI